MRKRRRLSVFLLALLLFGSVVGVLSLRPHVYLPAHRHCIKQAGMALDNYATDHKGQFPKHKDGYGNALLLLDEINDHSSTGPGYSPATLTEARAGKRHLPEEACGRVYIQGLNRQTDSKIAILFDKLSTPGGDHCHWPIRLWASRGREVLFRDGSFRFIKDANWPTFAAEQIELLVVAGIPRAEAERLYAQVVQ